jgi:Na+/pantothenate symporter
MLATMVIALTSTSATIGLVVVFLVIFPALVQGLIAFIIVQVLGERAENQEYASRHRGQ